MRFMAAAIFFWRLRRRRSIYRALSLPQGAAASPWTDLNLVRIDATSRARNAACHGRCKSMTKRNFLWSELSKRHDRVEKEWIQWIELVAGLSAMIVLTLSLLAVWDGKSP
jgi:hypothetical protein